MNEIDNNIEEQEELDFIAALRSKGKATKEMNKYFDAFIKASIVEVEDTLKDLLSIVEDKKILEKMKLIDMENCTTKAVSRILLLLNYIDQKQVVGYDKFFKDKYSYKKDPVRPEYPKLELGESMTKEMMQEYNEKVRDFNKTLNIITEYNSNVNSVFSTLMERVDVDLYGDQTLNTANLRYVYFKFFGLDKSYIESFIKDIKKTNASGLELIKRIDIEDISGSVPDGTPEPYDVKFYFEDGNDAEIMNGCNTLFEATYDRYCQMSDILKRGSADFGFDLQKQNNLQTVNKANSFQGTQNLTPYANPMNTPTSNDVDLLEEIDEEELEAEGIEYLKNQLNKEVETDYATTYVSDYVSQNGNYNINNYGGSMGKVPPTDIPTGYDKERHNEDGGNFTILNYSSGLQYMYIIHKPFTSYMDDGYQAIEFIEFDDGTVFNLDYHSLSEAEDGIRVEEDMDVATLNHLKNDEPDIYNDCVSIKLVKSYVDHIVV